MPFINFLSAALTGFVISPSQKPIMRKETDYFIKTIRTVLEGEPWFGQPVMTLLQNVNTDVVYKKPNENAHALIELLYHMLTWAEFTLKRLQKDEEKELKAFEKMDWRTIDPAEHTWEKGLAQFKLAHDLIIDILESKENDDWLSEKVDYREYNYRFLLHGIIQHDIYHIGQIAYLNKLVNH